jgi:glc operon protein GlcG
MPHSKSRLAIALLCGASVFATDSFAADPKPAADQKPAAPVSTYAIPIGATISLDNAKRVAAAAAAEARKNNWHMAIAVVDPAGTLIYYEKMDDTQIGSANVAIDKARSAALFKRPTKAFQDAVAGGGLGVRILGLQGAVPLEGGTPLMSGGKLVGAIGVSGDLSENDGKCAAAAVALLK